MAILIHCHCEDYLNPIENEDKNNNGFICKFWLKKLKALMI